MGGTQSSINGYGYHVLKVQEKSPAQKAGIEPFFDYIIGMNGISLEPGSQTFQEKLLSHIDKEVILLVYSTKEQEYREVNLIPSKTWSDETDNGIIGCIIRYCSYEGINEHVWHILEIAQKSPAEMAGLVPLADYVIGTPHETLESESDFYDLIDNHLGRPLRLYVYNSDVDACREVTIVPNNEWGGEGSLGCGVGYGYLHRIPKTYKYQSLKRKFELPWDPSSFPHLNSPNPPPQLINKDEDNNYSDITTFVPYDSNVSNVTTTTKTREIAAATNSTPTNYSNSNSNSKAQSSSTNSTSITETTEPSTITTNTITTIVEEEEEKREVNEIESVENIEKTTTTESGDTDFKFIDEKSEVIVLENNKSLSNDDNNNTNTTNNNIDDEKEKEKVMNK